MRTYTVHLKPACEPVLVREGWSWWAFLFGPFWLLAQRAWIPGVINLALSVSFASLAPSSMQAVLALGLGVLTGLLGRDLVRWSLERRGYLLTHVVAARDADGALARLLHARADLHASAIGPLG